MLGKLIVTNRAAMLHKYGKGGWRAIDAALEVLIAADRTRGIDTRVVRLDARQPQRPRRTARATQEADCKHAIDRLCRSGRAPDYLLILGATDVVPHQTLRNPIVNVEDIDADLPSDLPYACDAPYSTDVSDFIGPTRVVGRLPDVVGARDPRQLIRLIENAATFVGTAGQRAFALSAAFWESATRENLRLALTDVPNCALSPPDGPAWPASALHAPLHFINLHGADTNPDYYGQPADGANEFPLAHQAALLAGRVTAGTVVAAECCYGAQLYRPRAGIPPAMAQTYLAEGAGAFMGSTNIAFGAFGPDGASRRCNADVLCTEFMAAIGRRASTGRALLQARQAYVQRIGRHALDVFDLKTLGQFLLLGDPSLRPHGGREPRGAAASTTRVRARMTQPSQATHRRRRRRMQAVGRQLKRTVRCASQVSRVAARSIDAIAGLLTSQGLRAGKSVRFTVPGRRKTIAGKSLQVARREQIHVVFARSGGPRRRVRNLTAVIARTLDGQLVSYRTVKAR